MKKMEGILFVATSEINIKEVLLAAKTVRRHCGDVSMTIFTNYPEAIEEGYFESVIKIDRKGDERLKTYDKVLHLLDTPYERTIFLDTDTYVMSDIRDLFILLDKFDIALAHSPMRNMTNEMYHQAGVIDINSIPYSFPTFQSGVIAYKKNDKVWKTLDDFKNTYESKQYFFDQASMKETLWFNKHDLRIWALPPEYNFTKIDLLRLWRDSSFKQATPKVFHYCVHKNEDIEMLLENLFNENKVVELSTKQKLIVNVKRRIKNSLNRLGLLS